MQLGLRLLLVLAMLLGQAATQLHGYAHLADDLSRVASVDAGPDFDPEVNPGFSAEPAQGSSGHALGKCLQYHACRCCNWRPTMPVPRPRPFCSLFRPEQNCAFSRALHLF